MEFLTDSLEYLRILDQSFGSCLGVVSSADKGGSHQPCFDFRSRRRRSSSSASAQQIIRPRYPGSWRTTRTQPRLIQAQSEVFDISSSLARRTTSHSFSLSRPDGTSAREPGAFLSCRRSNLLTISLWNIFACFAGRNPSRLRWSAIFANEKPSPRSSLILPIRRS